MSGLLLGILLARSLASLVAAQWGWRSIYLVSAGLMVASSLLLRYVLPRREPNTPTATWPCCAPSVGWRERSRSCAAGR